MTTTSYAIALGSNRPGRHGGPHAEVRAALAEIMHVWSWKDLDAVFNWVAKTKLTAEDFKLCVSSIVGEWGKRQPEKVKEWLLTLPLSDEQKAEFAPKLGNPR